MTTFSAQSGRVYWNTEGGSYELTIGEIDALLGIFAKTRSGHGKWLELDKAAQEAGYPGSDTSLKIIGRAA